MPQRIKNLIKKRYAATLQGRDQLLTILLSFAALLLVTSVARLLIASELHPLLLASMGASTIMLLVLPNSPLAQPYSFVLGHIGPALVGVLCAHYIPDMRLAAACTVGLSLVVMFAFDCIHPPGGATALVPVISAPQQLLGLDYVIFPVAINVLTLLLLAIVFNRYLLKRDYPTPRQPAKIMDHHSNDPSPLARLGISSDDLHNALYSFNAYLDITEEDLVKLYSNAQANAYTRKFGELRCRDIMSQDVKTVEFGTELEDAWALLRFHKVSVLPVVDRSHRVIGILSLVDFLKRANLKTYENFAEKLVTFIRRTADNTATKPEAVGQIMASPAFTVQDDAFIATIIPLLSDKGLHHVPVVNAERRLVGIIAQSDLISALYSGSLNAGEAS